MPLSANLNPPRPPNGLGRGATMLVVGRLVSAACGLVQVPIVLAQLGPEKFGVWVALVGIIWTVSACDGGLGFALQNRIATLLAGGQEQEAAGLGRRGLRLLWGVAAVVALCGAALAALGDWNTWLGVSASGDRLEVKAAVAIGFAAATLCIPLSLATRLAAARQQTWLTGWWTALASVLGLAAVIGAAITRQTLIGFTLAACVLPIGPAVGTWLHLKHRGEWFSRPTVVAVRPAGLWRESAAFFLPQVGAAFLGSFVPTLVALVSGPAAAATYGVLQRLFGLGLQMQTLALQPTWPAYTHAVARQDPAAARRLYHMSLYGSAAGAAALFLVVPLVTPQILSLWLGGNAPLVAAPLLWTVAGWHALQFLGQPAAMLLNGAGRPGVVAVSTLASIAMTLLLCPFLGGSHGTIGVVAALAIPYLAFNLPVVSWQARRTLAQFGNQPGVP